MCISISRLQISNPFRVSSTGAENGGNKVTNMLLRRKNSNHDGIETQATGRIYRQHVRFLGQHMQIDHLFSLISKSDITDTFFSAPG